jgi:phosphoglycolate phosphatase
LPKIGKKDWNKFQSSSMKDLCLEYNIGPVKLLKMAKAINQEFISLIAQADFYPDIKQTLFSLKKNYQLGILSSNELSNIERFFTDKNLSLSSIFSFWRCEKELFGKDRALKALMKEQEIDSTQILYFGDQVRDIEACQRVDVQVAAVSWGFVSEELLASAKPNYLLNQPSEIMDLLAV